MYYEFIDEDELECPNCGHIGLMPNGGDEYECPCCGELVYPFDFDGED